MTTNCLWAELYISEKRLKGDSSLWCRVSSVIGLEVYLTAGKRLPHSPALPQQPKGICLADQGLGSEWKPVHQAKTGHAAWCGLLKRRWRNRVPRGLEKVAGRSPGWHVRPCDTWTVGHSTSYGLPQNYNTHSAYGPPWLL